MLLCPLCGPLSPGPSLSVTHPLALSGAEKLTEGHGRGDRAQGGAAVLPRGPLPRDSCSEPGCALGMYPPNLTKPYNSPMA